MDDPTASNTIVLKPDGAREYFDDAKLTAKLAMAFGYRHHGQQEQSVARIVALSVPIKLGLFVNSRDICDTCESVAVSMASFDPLYEQLAVHLNLESIYAKTAPTFSDAMVRASKHLSMSFVDFVVRHSDDLNAFVEQKRDKLFRYVGLVNMRRTYLLQDDNDMLFERPQYLWLRVAIQIHGCNLSDIKRTYDMLSKQLFIPSTTIIRNSGKLHAKLASEYSLSVGCRGSSLFDTVAQLGKLGSNGSCISIGLHDTFARGITEDGREQGGILPTIKLYEAALKAVNENSSNLPITGAVSIETWHSDISTLLKANRAKPYSADAPRSLSYAVMVNDLFMRRVEADAEWTLFCPGEAPTLTECYGAEFDEEYAKYEARGINMGTVKARALWKEITETLLECGGPAVIFKDATNRKSNDEHLGTVTQCGPFSNTAQYTDSGIVGACSSFAIALPALVNTQGRFDFGLLGVVVRRAVVALNCVVKTSVYPDPGADASARDSRAISITIQGLADLFSLLRIPWGSEKAHRLSVDIAESVHYHALDESCNATSTLGPYPEFRESHLSMGVLQPDLWSYTTNDSRHNWTQLRAKVTKGVANSVVTAYGPSVSAGHITGWSPGAEPYHSLVSAVDTPMGLITCFPLHLVRHLRSMSLWNHLVRASIIDDCGSIQNIGTIPVTLRVLYRTVWEVDSNSILEMAAERGPFVCQSQSTGLFLESPRLDDISELLMSAWKLGLKTGLHVLQTRPARLYLPVRGAQMEDLMAAVSNELVAQNQVEQGVVLNETTS